MIPWREKRGRRRGERYLLLPLTHAPTRGGEEEDRRGKIFSPSCARGRAHKRKWIRKVLVDAMEGRDERGKRRDSQEKWRESRIFHPHVMEISFLFGNREGERKMERDKRRGREGGDLLIPITTWGGGRDEGRGESTSPLMMVSGRKARGEEERGD